MKRLRAIFQRPKRKLLAVMPKLQVLRTSLKHYESVEPLDDIVFFFNTISEWHDRGVNDLIDTFEKVNQGQYDEMIQQLKILKKHFERAGRNKFGMNRTEPGETVTPDKVFLGNVWGLHTQSVSFWKKTRSKDAYSIVSRQAREFMDSHIEGIIPAIAKLEAAVH